MSVQSYHTTASCEPCEAYLNMCTAHLYWVDVCETRGTMHFHNHYFYIRNGTCFNSCRLRLSWLNSCLVDFFCSWSEERSSDTVQHRNNKYEKSDTAVRKGQLGAVSLEETSASPCVTSTSLHAVCIWVSPSGEVTPRSVKERTNSFSYPEICLTDNSTFRRSYCGISASDSSNITDIIHTKLSILETTTALTPNEVTPLLAICFGMRARLCGSGGIPLLAPTWLCILTIGAPAFSTHPNSFPNPLLFFTLFGFLPCNCCSLYQRIAWLHSFHSYLLPVTGRAVSPAGRKTPPRSLNSPGHSARKWTVFWFVFCLFIGFLFIVSWQETHRCVKVLCSI